MSAQLSPAANPLPRTPVIPSGVMGMLIFVVAEAMCFAGFISGFTIVRSGALPGMWPPPDQPRLPAAETALNTSALLLSAATLFWAHRRFRQAPQSARAPLWVTFFLGAAFVGLQGKEWVALLGQGLTLTSSPLGSFFYLIVGAHALHAVAALGMLAYSAWALRRGTLTANAFLTAQVFWHFVVLLWPFIYLRVYF